jgi:hypothetical protein
VKPGGRVEVRGNTLRHTLEPLSATLFVFQKG